MLCKIIVVWASCPWHEDIDTALSGNDPGVYTRAHQFLRIYQRTHRYAVVVLDNAWEASPGVEKIHNDIRENLIATGWDSSCCMLHLWVFL